MSSNSRLNLVSAKSLIGEFLIDFDIQNPDFIGRLNRYVGRGIELMDIDTYFRRCTKKATAYNNSVYLPCNAKYLEAVIVNDKGNPYQLDLGNDFASINFLNKPTGNFVSAYVEDNYLNFNEFDGEVFIIYRGLPTNKEGYCLFPDDPWLHEALLYFLIAKMGLSGYKHKIISREEAEQKWAYLYPRARNSVNFPTISEVESFADMWTNPLFHNIDRLKTGGSTGNPNIGIDTAYPSNYNKLIDYQELIDKLTEYLNTVS